MSGHQHSAELLSDQSRVITRLFLPGEGLSTTHSRAAEIVARVLTIPADVIESMAATLLADFSTRHAGVGSLFEENGQAVSSRVASTIALTASQRIVLGAAFTAEYAVEGAALCNPSAVRHPDQSGLKAGELRVALALRSIGDGHLSSIEFAEAVIGADDRWTFTERATPLAKATVSGGDWSRDHFHRALEHEGHLTELSSAVLRELPERFTAARVEAALVALPVQLTEYKYSHADIDTLRNMVTSAYHADFDAATSLSQRVLLPVAVEENHGMEDARFVRFTDADGSIGYRATYTAFDGYDIAPRLITSPDLASFAIHRLTGSAAHNKGMALFPRLVGGEHLALCRADGESISLARSGPDPIGLGPCHEPRHAGRAQLVYCRSCVDCTVRRHAIETTCQRRVSKDLLLRSQAGSGRMAHPH